MGAPQLGVPPILKVVKILLLKSIYTRGRKVRGEKGKEGSDDDEGEVFVRTRAGYQFNWYQGSPNKEN